MNSHDHSAMCSQSVACAPPLRQPAPPHCCKVLWVWGLKCRHRALKLYSQVKWRGPWDPGHHIFLLLPLHDIWQYLPNRSFHCIQNIAKSERQISDFREEISGNTSIELDRLNCADSAFIVCRTDDELMKNGWRTDGKLMKNWWKTNEEVMRNWWRTVNHQKVTRKTKYMYMVYFQQQRQYSTISFLENSVFL